MSFESHITIEPVFGERFQEFEQCALLRGFKPAELLLQKTRQETPQRSNKDSFCTGHDLNYSILLDRTTRLVIDLKESGFKVWRYKIEAILLDVRNERLFTIEAEPRVNA